MFQHIESILNAPWAILPASLAQIQTIALAHARGEKFDVAAFSTLQAKPNKAAAAPYEIIDGVAIINIDGVIARRMNLFMQACGGTSTELLTAAVQQAAQDPAVGGILLNISSPGGSAFGVDAAAGEIRKAAQAKPVVAWVPDMMASAATWLGTAASTVLISENSTMTGNLGVVMQHVDLSQAQASEGRVLTDIYAGTYKRIDSQNAPLSLPGRAYLQAQVDQIYSVMLDRVSINRGVAKDVAHETLADGKTFIGSQAIDAGLVDGLANFEEALARAKPRIAMVGAPGKASLSQSPHLLNTSIGHSMDLTQEQIAALSLDSIRAARADLAQAFQAEGGKAERDRIAAVRAQSLPGHEALIESLAADGVTTGPEAAVKIIQAETALVETNRASAASERIGPLSLASAATEASAAADENLSDRERLHGQVLAKQQATPGMSYVNALKAVMADQAIAQS